MGGGKSLKKEDTNSIVQSSYDVYMHPQRANIPLQGLDRRAVSCTDSGSHIRSPQPTWSPPLAPFHQSWNYMVGKKHSGKADQSTLASGDSEHA